MSSTSKGGEEWWPAVPYVTAARIEQVASHEYKCNVHPEYSYGPAAHGGFLMALIARAIGVHFATTLAKSNQPDTFSFHVEFLRPTGVGDGTITIKDLRLGKTSSSVQATLMQNGHETVTAIAINAGPAAAKDAPNIPMDYTISPTIPPVDFAAALAGTDRHWIRYDHRWIRERPNHAICNALFLLPRDPVTAAPPQVVQQWTAPRRADERWTTDMLGLLLDHVVISAENFVPGGAVNTSFAMSARAIANEREGRSSYVHPMGGVDRWYPTVNFSVHVVRQLPPEGAKWLLVRAECKEVVQGRLSVQALVLDPAGRLIATAQSVSLVIPVARSAVRKGLLAGNTESKGQSKI